MTYSILAAALFVASTAAQCSIEGAEGGGIGPDASARYPGPVEEIIHTANSSPNETSSVTFNFTTTASNFETFTQEWTWTVNISEISTAGFNGSFLGAGILDNDLGNDTYFTNTVYSLQWPGVENLNDYLNNATHNATGGPGTLCFARLDLAGLPCNVSNNYSESDNGDCTNALGADCVAAVLAQLGSVGSSGSCPNPGGLRGIPECASTLGQWACGSSSYTLGNATETDMLNQTTLASWNHQRGNYSQYPIESGDSVFFRSSGEHRADNLTWYQQQGQQLQAIILSGATQRTMLCQKVNKTAAAVTSDGQESGASVASEMGLSSFVIFGLAGLTALLAVV